jgi:phasin family protein
MAEDVFKQWVEFTKNATEPMQKLNEVSARALEKVAQQQFDLARDYVDLGTRQMQLLGQAKDPQKWAQDQAALASEFGKKLVARAQESVALATQTQKEMTAFAEDLAKSPAAKPKT